MDKIHIKRLEVFANHGVLEEENRLGQKFLVSVCLYGDFREAGRSDALKDSVNYAAVCELICDQAKKHTFHLIERFAQHLAEQILCSFPLVQGVDIEVEKPWAPVHLPLETVSVQIHRSWHKVALGLGSNLGDKQQNLMTAVRMLTDDAWNRQIEVSGFIETEPVGGVPQDDFLNGAMVMETLYTPEELLQKISEIEQVCHRVRTQHWGPRTIDVDILLYDDQCIATKKLLIPHPQMCYRGFVLEPLQEIAPYLIHPMENKFIVTLYEEWKNKNEKGIDYETQ